MLYLAIITAASVLVHSSTASTADGYCKGVKKLEFTAGVSSDSLCTTKESHTAMRDLPGGCSTKFDDESEECYTKDGCGTANIKLVSDANGPEITTKGYTYSYQGCISQSMDLKVCEQMDDGGSGSGSGSGDGGDGGGGGDGTCYSGTISLIRCNPDDEHSVELTSADDATVKITAKVYMVSCTEPPTSATESENTMSCLSCDSSFHGDNCIEGTTKQYDRCDKSLGCWTYTYAVDGVIQRTQRGCAKNLDLSDSSWDSFDKCDSSSESGECRDARDDKECSRCCTKDDCNTDKTIVPGQTTVKTTTTTAGAGSLTGSIITTLITAVVVMLH